MAVTRRPIARIILLAITALLGSSIQHLARGQRSDDSPAPKSDTLAAMKRQAEAIKVVELGPKGEGEPAALRTDPIARYNDEARRIHDATLWLWTDGRRPIAALKVEHYPINARERRWIHGLVSLTTERITIDSDDGWHWSSRRAGLEPRPFENAPAPASSESQRLLQMKELARRFEVVEYNGPARGDVTLRLLPRPLYRQSDSGSTVSDRAIFSFAYGTNPDVLLIVEARARGGATPAWFYSLARLGGGAPSARLDGTEVWKLDSANPPADKETYANHWHADNSRP